METNYMYLENGLKVSVDWLAFTFTMFSSPERAIELMGYSIQDFTKMPRGGMGYKSRLRSHSGLSLLFDGNADMGVHVVIPGSSVSDLLEHYCYTRMINTPFGVGYDIPVDSSCLAEFLSMVTRYGSFSRVDLAVDDIGARFYSMEDVLQVLNEGCFVSKFRSYRNVCEKTTSGAKTGHTIYMGKRTSEIMLRVYDKRLEQNGKNADSDAPEIMTDWVRWELELHGDRADRAVKELASGKELGEVCVGVLGNYMRVINLDNSNKSRCSIDATWEWFLNGIAPLKLYVKKEKRTLDDSRRWLQRQVAPTLTAVVAADGGSIEFVEKMVYLGLNRLNKRHLDMIAAENPFYGVENNWLH